MLTIFLYMMIHFVLPDAKAINSPMQNLMMDPQKRLSYVDEAFIEQKDVILDMLETKLKEVRDKKKSKKERGAFNNNNNNGDGSRRDTLPRNLDIKYKASGISGVGDLDLTLKFGNQGKGLINLDATGISNIGKARLELGVGEDGINLPGLSQLFGQFNGTINTKNNEVSKTRNDEVKNVSLLGEQPSMTSTNDSIDARRTDPINPQNETVVQYSTLVPLTSAAMQWEIPTTPRHTTIEEDSKVDNSTSMRASDNSTVLENATIPVVIVSNSSDTANGTYYEVVTEATVKNASVASES